MHDDDVYRMGKMLDELCLARSALGIMLATMPELADPQLTAALDECTVSATRARIHVSLAITALTAFMPTPSAEPIDPDESPF